MSKKKIENLEKRDRGAEVFSRAIEALRRGEVIVFPTETFYGLGADAFDETAVERVASVKGRDGDSPIPIIVADEKMLKNVVAEIPPVAERLMARFWPGPLTLVLPAKKGLAAPLLNRDG
ncbi:MAG: L-threonylcarbamoyladenylate synthase, partial [Candidatus Binatia bacterium]